MSSKRFATIAIAALGALLSSNGSGAIRLLPAGHFHAGDGSGRPSEVASGWYLDDAAAAKLIARAAARASDYVVDFEHQTLNAATNGQPAPASGWFKQLEWRSGDGLYLLDARWTDKAARMIAAQEYRYISPVFSYDKTTGEVLAIHHAALTNNPGLDGLTDLSTAALSAMFLDEEDAPMKLLLVALGLAATATETEALTALNAVLASKAEQSTQIAALTAKVATPDPAQYAPIAVLSAVRTELATATTELVALKAAAQVVEVDGIVAEALTAGKLTPAMDAWAKQLGKTDVAALKAFIAAAPVIAKPGTTQTGGAGGNGGAGQGAAATDTDLAVMKALGQTPEQFAAGKTQSTQS